MTGIKRRETRRITIGGVAIGGGAPVSVQSMTKTDTRDIAATLAQINELTDAGCEIVRLAIPDEEAADAVSGIIEGVQIPLIADIHFDYRLALKVISHGINGLRINPGNIGADWKVREVVSACKDRGIPIRIGVNAGSLPDDILARHGGHPNARAIVESAERHIGILTDQNFESIKVSLKASNVMTTIEAYELFSSLYDYPLHIGISEAGPGFGGTIKSSTGLGILLYQGIGDTMRVSLTENPVTEVRTAYEILKSLGIRQRGADIISCPTCGRCKLNIMGLIPKAEERIRSLKDNITVAIMGCAVNGPGEAREADYGIAGGSGSGLVFAKGKVVKKVKEEELLDALFELIEQDKNKGD